MHFVSVRNCLRLLALADYSTDISYLWRPEAPPFIWLPCEKLEVFITYYGWLDSEKGTTLFWRRR